MEDLSTTTLSIALFFLILASAFFSGTETSMMAINRIRLRSQVKEGNEKAKRVTRLLDKIDELIGAILLGNNFINIFASALATVIAIRLWGNDSIALASLLLTVVILIFAEVTPKTYAAQHPEKIALPASAVIVFIIKLLRPLIWFVNLISRTLLKLFRIEIKNNDRAHLSREELRMILGESHGLVSLQYQKMLLNIINLEKETVDDVMIPKNEMLGIDINDEESIMEQLTHTQHTRLLVFDGDEDNIIGTIHMRNLVNLYAQSDFSIDNLKKSIKEPYFVLEGTSLSQQLISFQKEHRSLALVVDEYGNVGGMIVLEDILEEIVGNFTSNLNDKFEEIEQQADGSYLIDARINIKELNRHIGTNIPTNTDAKTINGLILEHLEDIPQNHTSFKIDQYLFNILQTSKHGVRLVSLKIDKQQDDDEKSKITSA